MSAPTAIKSTINEPTVSQVGLKDAHDDDDDEMIDVNAIPTGETAQEDISSSQKQETAGVVFDESGKPKFTAASKSGMKVKLESRKVPVPPHRMTPLKNTWPKIYPPLVDHLKLQVRMNLKTRTVEMKTNKSTTDQGALQKGADFVKAFTLGFDVDDAIALLRLDDLYIETFEVKDVKTLTGDHLSRAIGRIAGKDGKTKFAIENATRTRIVLADSKIHILGGFTHIRMAREAVVSLILGSPPGKVYGNLRTVASRMKERY
ncbi:pre-rRNA-processing protein pno1 [Yamadazyma tenuis]|uniref:Pre-rRNA-processing protein PNO1 n=1 Tax=Candida tenuis (strain ATCC 10573 / BCRC 21748 / CBS 615 / JCM 9827 / NBRC 10315 / NRRL Y-1498 / VKM Y-70) TaxID=590646 RepID=G3AXF9_CANTC|nr:eukaryotic type KH-domain (KH-domain type I) [Yamadazyma tenuis ATCC 10573]EGV66367.1 eukaryotic type KH-domain (KH-domain type I) [Yamadazyma tenuis ATCC 10573]WEJ95512.1 pre-rRNA-processing protein pno1 [Yamadazyma tenuis]